MPITPVALALIQRAGEALQKANLQIAQEMAGQSSGLVATITAKPFGSDADKALTDLRNVAVIHHELGSLEEKLKTIYLSAMKVVAEPGAVEVIKAIAHHPRVRQQEPDAPEDVQSRPVVGKSKRGPKPRKEPSSRPLSPSARKVLAALGTILNKSEMTAVQQTSLAAMTAVSTASVNTAIKVLVTQGLIVSDGKGAFRLP